MSLLYGIGCAHPYTETDAASKGAPRGTVTYYLGEVQVLAPDGVTAYGPPKTSLVKRSVVPEKNRILEDVVQDGETYLTTLLRIDHSSTFEGSDDKGTFRGTLTFMGEEWAWNSWAYDITLQDGSGKLLGKGTLTEGGLQTEKKMIQPSGETTVLLRENFSVITEEEYERQLQLLQPDRSAK